MEVVAVIAVVGYVTYLAVREHKSFDIKPRINESHVRRTYLNSVADHEAYIKKVVAEGDEKERTGKLRAENEERIKKDFL